MLRTKDEKEKIGQIPGVAEVIFEIRHAPIGFILDPKDFENRQFGLKSPQLVTLIYRRKKKSLEEVRNFYFSVLVDTMNYFLKTEYQFGTPCTK